MMNILRNVSLKPYNTFGLEATARFFARITSPDDLNSLINSDLYKNENHFVLGGGSNILFTSNYEGIVIKNELTGTAVVNESDDFLDIKVQSGEVWHALVMHCVTNNWGGIENLSLIPGTVGAAPIQNIGAYGVEVKDCIKAVEGVDLSTGELMHLNREQCEFGYRESVFKHALREKIFISSVTLSLTKKNHHLNIRYGAIQDIINQFYHGVISIQTISESVIQIRKSKLPDPTVIGNAGSFFKNPTISLERYRKLQKQFPTIPGYISENQEVKVPAGWLIESCGWKGKKENEIGVHPHQALVLVNYGNGKGKEIFDLAMRIQASVLEKFFIKLTPEVNIF